MGRPAVVCDSRGRSSAHGDPQVAVRERTPGTRRSGRSTSSRRRCRRSRRPAASARSGRPARRRRRRPARGESARAIGGVDGDDGVVVAAGRIDGHGPAGADDPVPDGVPDRDLEDLAVLLERQALERLLELGRCALRRDRRLRCRPSSSFAPPGRSFAGTLPPGLGPCGKVPISLVRASTPTHAPRSKVMSPSVSGSLEVER